MWILRNIIIWKYLLFRILSLPTCIFFFILDAKQNKELSNTEKLRKKKNKRSNNIETDHHCSSNAERVEIKRISRKHFFFRVLCLKLSFPLVCTNFFVCSFFVLFIIVVLSFESILVTRSIFFLVMFFFFVFVY